MWQSVFQIKLPNASVADFANIDPVLNGLPLLFQREQAGTLNAIYHFTFTGKEQYIATVKIQNKALKVENELVGTPHFRLVADSSTWLGFLNKEKSPLIALLTRKLRIKGSPKLLLQFAKCFPS
jgi:putative sterol carrier protein